MRFVLIVISICLFWSCSSEETYDPPVPFEQMESILLDIYTIEVNAAMKDGIKVLNKDKDQSVLSENYASVLHHYQISHEEFRKALNWYIEHPVLLDSLYKKLLSTSDSLQLVYEPLREKSGSQLGTPVGEDIEGEINSMSENQPIKDSMIDTSKNQIRPEFLKIPEHEAH